MTRFFFAVFSLAFLFSCSDSPERASDTEAARPIATPVSATIEDQDTLDKDALSNTEEVVPISDSSEKDPGTTSPSIPRSEIRTKTFPDATQILDTEESPKSSTSPTTTAPANDPPSVKPELAVDPEPITEQSTQVDHSKWDELLRQYISAKGKVDYAGLKKNKTRLENYLDELSSHPVQSDWSRHEKMAYWINAYNAFTVKLIVDNYPLKSITALHGGKPWDVKWIKLGDKMYSLNQIEHDILRPQFKDARIHFAVNCAARSCPPLLNRAWTASNLNDQLNRQTRAFINDPTYNSIQSDRLELSKIFEWYAEDFGQVATFIDQYTEKDIAADAVVSFRDYNWDLNN